MTSVQLPADSRLRRVLDFAFFPYRGFLLHQDSTALLTSLRDERMREVARHCVGRVLDLGCGPGNLFIRKFYPNGIGVDVFRYPDLSDEQIIDDPCHLPFADSSFDTVTLIGVGGHIPRAIRKAEFSELARVIKPGGRLVMTEGEPVTQYILHKWIALVDRVFKTSWDLDGQRGMHEEEEYAMATREILELYAHANFEILGIHRFQWGLNKVFVGVSRKA